MKERGNSAYHAKRFADAVRYYLEIASLDSGDAAVRNDIGAAYLKLGKKDSAREAAREAARLAGRGLAENGAAAWSFRDLGARKSAYFTLDRADGALGPLPEPERCETWPASPVCGARLHVCAESGRRPSAGGILHWDILRVGLTRGRALFTYDEVEIPSLVPRPEPRDMEHLSIEGVPESEMRWLNRDSSATLLLEERLETADPECAGTGACGGVEKVLTRCRIVHADPCAGVVGLACALEGDLILMDEAYLIPSR